MNSFDRAIGGTEGGGNILGGIPVVGGLLGGGPARSSSYGQIDPGGHLGNQANAAGKFGQYGAQGYKNMTGELGQDREYLRRLQRGEESVSAEQLRQGLMAQQGMMQGAAASARPGAAPMAARTAMMAAGRASSGMAGNAALAGIAERQAAAQSLANLNLGQRGQDINAALGGQQNAISGYSALEQARASRYAADMGAPSNTEVLLGGLSGIAGGIWGK